MTNLNYTFNEDDLSPRTTFERKYLEHLAKSVGSDNSLPPLIPNTARRIYVSQLDDEVQNKSTQFEMWKSEFLCEKSNLDKKGEELHKYISKAKVSTNKSNNDLIDVQKMLKTQEEKNKELEKELDLLIANEKKLKQDNQKILDRLDELKPYTDYLESVVENSSTFTSLPSLFERIKVLKASRNESMKKFKSIMSNVGIEERELLKVLDEKHTLFIDKITKTSRNIAQNNQIKKENKVQQIEMQKQIEFVEGKKAEFGKIMLGIKSMYREAKRKVLTEPETNNPRNKKPYPDVSEMLDFILSRYKFLTNMLSDPNIELI